MNHNLIPCPFCGREDTPTLTTAKELEMCRNEDCTLDYRNCYAVAVVCDYNKGGCGACGGYGSTEQEAVDKWNERAERADGGAKWQSTAHMISTWGSLK